MINNLILVGSIANEINVNHVGDYDVCNICLRVTRPFRDMETNEYKSDFIPVSFWNVYALRIQQHCTKGDIVGVKGRLVRRSSNINGVNVYTTEVIGEKIVFINTKKFNDQFKNLKDRSSESPEEYQEPSLEDLKRMAQGLDKEDLDQELINQTNQDFLTDDEFYEQAGKPKKKSKQD